MDILYKEIYSGILVWQLGAGVIALFVLSKLFGGKGGRSKAASRYSEGASCPNCGWTGAVSGHTRTCPKCAESIVHA